MPTPRSKSGLLRHEDGSVEPARFYYGDQEQDPPDRTRIDPAHYATWIEDDGAVGIRRGTSISVGATAAYSANYDALDWGN
jgi:hypothetical protein